MYFIFMIRLTHFRRILVPFLLACLTSFSTVSQDFSAQRKIYLNAEKHVWVADSASYQNLYNQLHYYPLQPYLDQQRLMHKINLDDEAEIGQFLTQYRGSPMDWPLRKKWLNYLAKRKRKALFIKYFKSNSSAKLNCTHLQFQLDTGKDKHTVLAQVEPLWLVGKSQDKSCDPIFKLWIKAGYLTDALVWQRLALAADGGKHTLIPYLTKLLPKHEQPLGKLWHSVRRDPANVAKLKKFKLKNNKEAQILTYGLKRLVWRAPDKAISTFEKATKDYPFSQQQRNAITARFAVALSSKHHQDAQQWISKVDDSSLTKNLVQWRLVEVLKGQNWQTIHDDLVSLPTSIKANSQWQYWYGRSLMGLNNKAKGEQVLTELAKKRHYYGFLAASQLEQPISLQDKPLSFTEQEKQHLLNNPAAKRAFELFYIERFHQARKEWHYWLSQLTKREKLIAATIAYENQWFDRPIFTLAKQGYLDDVKLRFPLAFEDKFTKFAKQVDIDLSWAMAISRRESSFMTDANSRVGAKGLMQIMPNTAKQLDKRRHSTRHLLKADHNIKLGTKYLKQLLKRYKGNQILATASYNAGPHRVKQWLAKLDDIPADIWIETIPFKETREYVKSVLAYQQIYQYQTGVINESPFNELVSMTIKQ